MSIREWPVGERPREKLLTHGAHSLSDAELLAILFRVGIVGFDAVALARWCLQQAGGLTQLMALSPGEFQKLKGMGEAKYVQLQGSIELSRRVLEGHLKMNQYFSSTQMAKNFFRAHLFRAEREVFIVAFLTSQYTLIRCETLFEGTINAAHVHVREVVKAALSFNAGAVVLCHNHPSGSLEPSDGDIEVTCRIKEALALVDVTLLDHILVGHGAVSFSELGLL